MVCKVSNYVDILSLPALPLDQGLPADGARTEPSTKGYSGGLVWARSEQRGSTYNVKVLMMIEIKRLLHTECAEKE